MTSGVGGGGSTSLPSARSSSSVDRANRFRTPDFGLGFGNPDFVQYAESYGAHGHRVESAEQLLPLMQKCHEEPGVHVIDVPVDYSDNDRILNHEIRELSGKI